MPKSLFNCFVLCLFVFGLSGCTTGTDQEDQVQDQTAQSEEQNTDTATVSDVTDTEEDSASTTDWTGMSLGEVESASEILTAIHFWRYVRDGEADEAIALMDADEATKEAWVANFATIEKLELERTSPVNLSEWTDTRQIFKTTLTVTVSEEGEMYGWVNGENARWITLQKNGSVWQVHELASNP